VSILEFLILFIVPHKLSKRSEQKRPVKKRSAGPGRDTRVFGEEGEIVEGNKLKMRMAF
jgi:hypothetical protein